VRLTETGENLKGSLSGYFKIVITLIIILVIINLMLIYYGQTNPAVFYAANAVVYFMVSLFFIGLSNRVRFTFSTIGIIIFIGFWIFVIGKVALIINSTLVK
jgi:hypothetical protein